MVSRARSPLLSTTKERRFNMEGISYHDFIAELMLLGGLVSMGLTIRGRFASENRRRIAEKKELEDRITQNAHENQILRTEVNHQVDLMQRDIKDLSKLDVKLDKVMEILDIVKDGQHRLASKMEKDHHEVLVRITALEEGGCLKKSQLLKS